jgi:hypothetical protein
MINAVRTLLMNRGVDGTGWDFPGEEFIEPNFHPKKWPGGITRPMVHLLGSAPDRLYLNYRMRQVMQLLHSTELEEVLYTLDNRVTYLPISDLSFFDEVFGQEYTQFAGIATVPLTIDGTHEPDDGVGLTTIQWSVTVMAANQIRVNRLTPPALLDNVVMYTESHGLSDYVDLPGSNLKFKFPTAYSYGAEWIITSKARPVQDLGVRMANMMRATDSEVMAEIFQMKQEPYLTLANTYQDNELFPYQASALLIAFALYMDTLPQEQ